MIPDYFKVYDRSKWAEQVHRIISSIKMDSTPGVPYALIGKTNGELFLKSGTALVSAVLDRIESRLNNHDKIFNSTKIELVQMGICDPVRVFVKDEPHKRKKLDEGRVRLIMSVSIVDKIIEMMINGELHKTEIANWKDIPSKPGIGFSEEDNQSVYLDVMSKGHMAYSDISGWDWNVKPWLMHLCARGTIELCHNPTSIWRKLVLQEPYIESNSVYQFSNGMLVTPIYSGVVNSGKYKTSRGNSFMRVLLSAFIGAEFCIAMGDDAVESFVENAVQKYAELGWNIKDYQRVEDGFEFCSRWYGPHGSFPLNADKMLMNLVHHKVTNFHTFMMLYTSFEDQLKNHPDFPEIIDLLKRVGFYQLGMVGAQIEDGEE